MGRSSINLLDRLDYLDLSSLSRKMLRNICEANLTVWSNWETNYVVFQSWSNSILCRQWQINPIYSWHNTSENLQKQSISKLTACNDDRQCIVGRSEEEGSWFPYNPCLDDNLTLISSPQHWTDCSIVVAKPICHRPLLGHLYFAISSNNAKKLLRYIPSV